jgi:hypothetical protein
MPGSTKWSISLSFPHHIIQTEPRRSDTQAT